MITRKNGLFAAVLCVSLLSSPALSLQIIELKPRGEGVIIAGDGILAPRHFELNNPPRLVIDFEGASSRVKFKELPLTQGNIHRIRIGQSGGASPAVRVVLDLKKKISYTMRLSSDKKAVEVISSERVKKIAFARHRELPKLSVAPRKVVSAVAPAEVPPPPVSKVPSPRRGPVISLNLKDADLTDVLRILAEKSGYNIVTDSTVSGKLTMFLKGVGLDDALNLILRTYNLAYQKVGKSIIVSTSDKLKSAATFFSEVIPLKYADATMAAKSIKDILTGGEKIQVNEDNNALVVTAAPDSMKKIKELIEKVDAPPLQVRLEARVLEISVESLKNLGFSWSDILSGGASYSTPTTTTGTTVTAGAPILVLSTSTLTATLNMLQRDGKAKILASPRLSTLSNKEANMLIGDRIPFTTTTFDTAGRALITVNFTEAGIKLSVTPLINEDNYITAKILTEVSFVAAYKGPNADIPQVRTRQAKTSIRVKDGDTIVMGGLLNTEDRDTLRKIPILGDVPLLGNLFFASTRKEKVQSDLIITITPHILREGETTSTEEVR